MSSTLDPTEATILAAKARFTRRFIRDETDIDLSGVDMLSHRRAIRLINECPLDVRQRYNSQFRDHMRRAASLCRGKPKEFDQLHDGWSDWVDGTEQVVDRLR